MLTVEQVKNEDIFSCLYKYEINDELYVCIEKFSSLFWWETRISVYLIFPEGKILLTNGTIDERDKLISDLYNWLYESDMSVKYKFDVIKAINFLESLYN